MRNLMIVAFGLALTGCITDDEAAADDGDATVDTDSGSTGGDSDGGTVPNPPDPDDGVPPPPPDPDDGVPPLVDAWVEPDPDGRVQPPPDDHDALVAALCDRMVSCFESDCPPFAGADFIEEICDSLDEQPNRVLRNLLDLECFDLLAVIFQSEEDVEAYCDDTPPTPECEQICSYLPECGVDDAEFCTGFCRTLSEDDRECYLDAREREDCGDFFDCFDQEPPPEPEEVCEPLCEKRWRCLVNDCAPGTVQQGWFDGCIDRCARNPPDREEADRTLQGLCEEILPGLFADDPELGARCEAEPDDACVQLCEGRLGECNIDECVTRCADWNETNFLCIQFVGECEQFEACIEDGPGRDICEQACDHYSTCLLEACPPRIIRPSLLQECAAGCLFDPPGQEELDAYLGWECRQVREQVYENNRELAPLCEGDREFRPSPEECVAFCESTLAECIGVGGRQFCLGACATLERDQYQCALEAQGDCQAIDRCLE